MSPQEGIVLARQRGLDLVEVAPEARPPVCKIVAYGKWKYEQSKQKDKSKNKAGKVKEIKFRINISSHDYMVKLQHAEEFLDDNNKLRVVLQFRGREGAHPELGFRLLTKVREELKTMGHVDMEPRQAGRQITMTLSPHAANQRVRKFEKPKHEYVEDVEDEEHDDREQEEADKKEAHRTLTLEEMLAGMEDQDGKHSKKKH